MVYSWKPGARLVGDAQVVGEEIARIAETHGGTATPELVKEAAREEASPLHPYVFDVPAREASERYYTERAGHVMRSLVVRVEVPEAPEPVEARAFVVVERQDERRYAPITVAMQNAADGAYMVAQARAELRAFVKRYEVYSACSGLVTPVRELLAQFESEEPGATRK
jgi:hypothetical protein